MALSGVKVLEFAGLAPAPFCGMILSDFGATVVRVDRAGGESPVSGNDLLTRGKKSICLNLKDSYSISIIKKIISKVCFTFLLLNMHHETAIEMEKCVLNQDRHLLLSFDCVPV